jgi:NAD(P)-dependent dehydrogenase (short-subunit alcohol dehydrogenase family)
MATKSMPLAGKMAMVTGASGGLGMAVCTALAAAGAGLILAGRNAQKLQEAARIASDLRVSPSQQITVAPAFDLSDFPAMERAVRQVQGDLPPVDILVNNAGAQGDFGPFAETDFEHWRHLFEVNFFSAARLTQLLLPSMIGRKWGRIINISGGGATAPRPHASGYGVAKCALVRWSETLAHELRPTGVTVNCVAPGAMNTRMLDERLAAGAERLPEEYAKAVEQSRTGGASPEEAAALVLFLASAASERINGKLISAAWDHWKNFGEHLEEISGSDIYTLRRIIPKDRGMTWG